MSTFFAQTPSSLQTYMLCPVQFREKYITKSVEFKQNKHAIFGERVHKALELYLQGLDSLPTVLSPMKELLDRMKPVLAGVETKLAINADYEPVDYYDREAYQRCMVDAILVNNDNSLVVCIDWKTGKKSDSQLQHDIIKRCAKAIYPDAKVITDFVYLFKGGYDRQVYEGQRLIALDYAMESLIKSLCKDEYLPKQNPLCKRWCDVKTCPFNGQYST